MARVKIGDIIGVNTSKGITYAIYTHKHKMYGNLIRVFEGFYTSPVADILDVVNSNLRFSTFFPLSLALDKNLVDIVDNKPVPDSLKPFPVFRSGVADPATGKVAVWWLWDGKNENRIGSLTDEQKKFPIRGVWNDTLLVERIESGWTPEADPTT